MAIIFTSYFKQEYQDLGSEDKEKSKQAISFLMDRKASPSFEILQIKGTDLWEVHITERTRLVYEETEQGITLHAIGQI